MKDLFLLAGRLQDFLDAKGWRFCFIGGIALQRWGEPRLTRDVDVAGVVMRQGKRLNWEIIGAELRPLADLKEAPGILDRLEEIRRRQSDP